MFVLLPPDVSLVVPEVLVFASDFVSVVFVSVPVLAVSSFTVSALIASSVFFPESPVFWLVSAEESDLEDVVSFLVSVFVSVFLESSFFVSASVDTDVDAVGFDGVFTLPHPASMHAERIPATIK